MRCEPGGIRAGCGGQQPIVDSCAGDSSTRCMQFREPGLGSSLAATLVAALHLTLDCIAFSSLKYCRYCQLAHSVCIRRVFIKDIVYSSHISRNEVSAWQKKWLPQTIRNKSELSSVL